MGYTDIVKELFAMGSDPNVISIDGWTPLQLAIHKNNVDGIEVLKKVYFIVLKLIMKQEKLNINELTNKGTALHVAAKVGKMDVVKFLLELGANILYFSIKNIYFSIKNDKGQMPIEVSANESVRNLLEESSLNIQTVLNQET